MCSKRQSISERRINLPSESLSSDTPGVLIDALPGEGVGLADCQLNLLDRFA
jgi:hypothetical protein